MAIIALEVPLATARLFGEIDVPGTREPTGGMHITIAYLGKGVSIDDVAEAVKATYAVTGKTRPFTVRATRVTSFPPSDEESHPIIARVDSDALHSMRAKLLQAFERAGVEFDAKFPVYKPHVTLSFGPDAVDEFRIPTIEWGAHEVVMWGGDEGDNGLRVTFPLALRPAASDVTTSIARRVAARVMNASASRGCPTTRA